MTAVAGPQVPAQLGNRPQQGGVIPFRRATTPRTSISISTSQAQTTGTQNLSVQLEGTGFITGIELEVVCVTAANAATVAFAADAPYNVLDVVSFQDTTGEELNLDGFSLYLLNLYGGYLPHSTLLNASTDTNVYQLTSGAGGTGGSFRFHLWVPVAINRRNFLGLLGNQDRSMKYTLRSDIGASGNVYTTPPTTLGTVTVNRTYESVTVPAPVNADKIAQQVLPPKFGVINFATRVQMSAVPVGGSTVNHYLPRIGNTIRLLILILKSNGSRATAESNLPTRIQFQLGDTPIFQESVQYRRAIMFKRWGFDAPPGVLVYDFIADLMQRAGDELGVDWLWTAGLANMQFQITYPAGFGSTNNSCVVVTSDILVPPGLDVYAPDGV
jgi:hypothetical protein